MEALQPCPRCLSDVEIIRVSQGARVEQKYYFFIQCHQCGKGTSKTYPSKSISVAIWNTMVLEDNQTYIR